MKKIFSAVIIFGLVLILGGAGGADTLGNSFLKTLAIEFVGICLVGIGTYGLENIRIIRKRKYLSSRLPGKQNKKRNVKLGLNCAYQKN